MLPATFSAEIEHRPDDALRMHTLVVPSDVATAVLATGSRRVLVTLAGATVARALQTRVLDPDGPGDAREHLIVLSGALVRDLGLRAGARLPVTLALDPAPDDLRLPDELIAALDLDSDAAARFATFTPGRQRSLGHYVASAKRPETREKRGLEIATKLRTYILYGDLHPESR